MADFDEAMTFMRQSECDTRATLVFDQENNRAHKRLRECGSGELKNAVECGFLVRGKIEIRAAWREYKFGIAPLRINAVIQSLVPRICVAA